MDLSLGGVRNWGESNVTVDLNVGRAIRMKRPDKTGRKLGEACFEELQLPLINSPGILSLLGCSAGGAAVHGMRGP